MAHHHNVTPPPPSPPTHPPPAPPPPSLPPRNDCWSQQSTFTLINAWGEKLLQLNHGSLRHTHWQEVADAVNSRHVKKNRRSDVQCKNRIDTLKKKYKFEKNKSLGRFVSSWPFYKLLDSLIGPVFETQVPSPVPETSRNNIPASPALPPPWLVPVGRRSKRSVAAVETPAVNDSAYFRRNFSVMAAAAVDGAESDSDSDTDTSWFGGGDKRASKNRKRFRNGKASVSGSDKSWFSDGDKRASTNGKRFRNDKANDSGSDKSSGKDKRASTNGKRLFRNDKASVSGSDKSWFTGEDKRASTNRKRFRNGKANDLNSDSNTSWFSGPDKYVSSNGERLFQNGEAKRVCLEEERGGGGYREVALAIGRFTEVYARVEDVKERQMVELEQQKMQFAKDLEVQRMKLMIESQVQFEKLRRLKSDPEDG